MAPLYSGACNYLRSTTVYLYQTSSVCSVVHDDEELLLALLDIDVEEVVDNEWATLSSNASDWYLACPYTSLSGGKRTRFFKKTDDYTSHYFTDYQGEVVPEEVISRMLGLANLSPFQVGGRGIQVSAEAFKMITDWK